MVMTLVDQTAASDICTSQPKEIVNGRWLAMNNIYGYVVCDVGYVNEDVFQYFSSAQCDGDKWKDVDHCIEDTKKRVMGETCWRDEQCTDQRESSNCVVYTESEMSSANCICIPTSNLDSCAWLSSGSWMLSVCNGSMYLAYNFPTNTCFCNEILATCQSVSTKATTNIPTTTTPTNIPIATTTATTNIPTTTATTTNIPTTTTTVLY
ncbi:integumentary mucin C.1-like [Homarus americanus]|uniref:integumentary mucin C.1-like n=1 Tax=Homarus americanus TaxID=6706 RepID=UPI001C47FD69|nr:integumentary mucin C.1-like [Homarus americanus]